MTFLKIAIFYGSYLYIPFVIFVLWGMTRIQHWVPRFLGVGVLVAATCVAYGRFVEPRILTVAEHNLKLCTKAGVEGDVRIAVFGDTHNGLFPVTIELEKIVERVETLSPDMVLVPGDLTYHPDFEDLEEIFAPLGNLTAPTYLVMGNHDEGIPGPLYAPILTKILIEDGINVIDGQSAALNVNDLKIRIVGMMDHWAAIQQDVPAGPYVQTSTDEAVIYLQHNPDMLTDVPDLGAFDLMVTGHTHGGQINLPFITCNFTFACDVHRKGFAALPEGNLFVTSGTGMTGLPMRFGVPPVIDMLNISFQNCAAPQGL